MAGFGRLEESRPSAEPWPFIVARKTSCPIRRCRNRGREMMYRPIADEPSYSRVMENPLRLASTKVRLVVCIHIRLS